ncbi:MAG: hypothetical protein BroJett018_46540 [Chloroflexota bacterium]|nr:MAG: hypothetical protein BroJett018_46540 [Chloroflexota bacterium]
MARLRLFALITLIGIFILSSSALAQGPLPLDETFTSTDGQITFSYPAGFVVAEDTGQIRLANNDALANSEPTGLVLLPGQVYMLFFTPDAIADAAALTGATISTPLDLMNVAGVVLGVAVPEGVTETTIQDNPAVTTPVISDPSTGIDTYLTGIQFGPAAFMLIATSTPIGELEVFQPTAQAILDTLTYGATAPSQETPSPEATSEATQETPTVEATATDVPAETPTETTPVPSGEVTLDAIFTSADGSFTFRYPSAWGVAEEPAGLTGLVAVSNNPVLPSLEPATVQLSSGDIYMLILSPATVSLYLTENGITDQTPLQLLNLMMSDAPDSTTFEEPTEITIGPYSALITRGSDPTRGVDNLQVVMQVGPGALVMIEVDTVPGELPAAEPTALTILATLTAGALTATPPATQVTPTSVTPVSGQLPLDANFISSDGTVFFSYPSVWSIMEGPLGYPGVIALANNSALVSLDPVSVTLLPGQMYLLILTPVYVDIYLAGKSVTATTALQVANLMLADARPTTVYEQPLEISIGAYPAVVMRSVDSTRGIESLQAVIQVGEQDFFILALDAPIGELALVEDTGLALFATLVYSPTAALATPAPTEVPTEAGTGAGTDTTPVATDVTPVPSITVAPVATTPAAPTATPIPRPEDTAGTLRLIYNNGTMTVYNGTNQLLDLRGLEFVSPDNRVRFISRDFGAFSLTYFEPGRCIHVHLFSQAYSPPEFCPSGPVTTQLAYQSGSTEHLYFVWNASFGYTSFLVQRNGQTVATCEIAAGQCTVPVPVTYFPVESLEQQ